MYHNNYQKPRQAWENILLSQLHIRVLSSVAGNIASQWKMIAMIMNIDPQKDVIVHSTSGIPIDLSNEMLTVAANMDKTVGDLNDALKKQGFSGYVLSASDVNDNLKAPLDILFSQVTLPSGLQVTRAITGYWKDIATLFNMVNDIEASVCPGLPPSDYAMKILPSLRNMMVKLSTWNNFARNGLIPFTLEVDGDLKQTGYEKWGYNVKMVPVPQFVPQPQQTSSVPVVQATQHMAVDTAQPMAVDTPQLTETERGLAK